MSPNLSYQRHTPGPVPFEETFSWQTSPCPTAVRTLSWQCSQVDGCRNLDDSLFQAVQAGQALGWLEAENRAYVQYNHRQLEILIHPDCRGQGWATWLLSRIQPAPPEGISIWAYGDFPRTVKWLESQGFTTQRLLYQLQRNSEPPHRPKCPSGFQVSTFHQRHQGAWLELHRKQQKDPSTAWSLERLQRQLQQPETPAQNFWMLWQGESLRGYLWLKQHEEIFMFALDPRCRGQGLGRFLLEWGLSHTSGRAWSFCDDQRPEALKLYRKLNFCEVGRDRCLHRCK